MGRERLHGAPEVFDVTGFANRRDIGDAAAQTVERAEQTYGGRQTAYPTKQRSAVFELLAIVAGETALHISHRFTARVACQQLGKAFA